MDDAGPVDHRRPVLATDADAIGRTFSAGGAVHVRGALDPGLIADVHAEADAVFRDWSELAAADRLPAELEAPLTRRYIPLTRLPVVADRLSASLHPFRALARPYLDKEPEIEPNSHVRSIVLERADAHLPFHQDQTILGRRLFNIWIPLDPCGRDAPGLEVVWESWRELLQPAPAEDAQFPVERARLDPATVVGRYGEDACWRPEFRVGDAMVFAGATIHRTYVTPHMTANRMSVEIRLI
jgi:hypothetical protein